MKSISVDFSTNIGRIKPLHGVNNGPCTNSFMNDASDLYIKAGIPSVRLHDVEGAYGCGEYVDIPCVFKKFTDDPDDPASYNFAATDHYIKAIINTGAKVIYRLGVTIENGPVKRYIYPPADYKQWARICEGIVRHYTEGWADGFENAVEYFEIWNEPNFYNHMWIGTDEEFYELFKSTIIYLKERFPNVKFGGPGMGYEVITPYTDGFFEYLVKGEKAPLDFFSWHYYWKTPEKATSLAFEAKDYLKKYGYDNAEVLCTEWNYIDDWKNITESYRDMRNSKGAAIYAASLCCLQNSPCDIANYYLASPTSDSFGALYDVGKVKSHDVARGCTPLIGYHSFFAFGELYRMGEQVKLGCDCDKIYAIAATDGKKSGILISRFDTDSTDDMKLKLDIKGIDGEAKHYVIDDENEFVLQEKPVSNEDEITMKPYSVSFLVWE